MKHKKARGVWMPKRCCFESQTLRALLGWFLRAGYVEPSPGGWSIMALDPIWRLVVMNRIVSARGL